MKKILSILLILCLCLSLTVSAGAVGDVNEIQDADTLNDKITLIENEEMTTADNEDIFDLFESFLTSEDNEELEKILVIAEKAAVFIYEYATQPEEPAVDLDTVIIIVRIAVTLIYNLVKAYG